MEGMDSIIHLAGIVGDPASKIDTVESTEINYLSTKLIVDAASYFQIKKFIFASTCSVYGASDNRLLNESSKINPVSLYAETKLKSENIILNHLSKKVTPIIFRTGTLFGLSERMRFDLVINLFVGQALTEHKIIIEGGEQWRPFLHVEDAANAYLLALQNQKSKIHGIFNLGGNELNHQLKDIVNFISQEIHSTKIGYSKITDKRNYRVSFNKIKKSLDFEPKRTISYGINEIKNAIISKKIKSWKNPIYYNNKFPLVGKNKNSKYYWK
jgi:nucleoside-diphosphate-sugar epimerase